MRKLKFSLPLAVVLIVAISGAVLAANQAFSPGLPWWTVDNGGGQSQADGYTLTGTIGQPDASQPMTGGSYSLTGGYWGSAVSSTSIYLPLVQR